MKGIRNAEAGMLGMRKGGAGCGGRKSVNSLLELVLCHLESPEKLLQKILFF